MADAVSTTTIVDDDKRLLVQLTNLSDGTGEDAVNKVDVSGLATRSFDGTTCTGVKINKIYHSVVGFTQVQLFWDATANTVAVALAQDSNGHMDFSTFGGLQNTSASGKTGDILLTTLGAASNDSYVIVLDCVKSF
tara:strand:- start:20 stop:427 length:408 start_codon:yes stop_codon:yes gene_type:complete